MPATKNLCAQISLELHQKISDAREESGLTTAQYITNLLIEYYEMKENGGNTAMTNNKSRTLPAGKGSFWWKATRPGRIRPRRPPPSSKNYLSLARQSKKRRTPSAGRPRTACLLLPPTCRMHTAPVGPTKATCWPLAADGESLCHQAVTTPYSAPYGPRCGSGRKRLDMFIPDKFYDWQNCQEGRVRP